MTNHIPPQQMSAFVDGETTQEESAAICGHLATCAACRAQHESLCSLEQTLTRLSTPAPAPDLLWDLRRRIATPPARRWGWVWGVAGVTVLAVGIAFLWPHGEAPTAHPVVATHHASTAVKVNPKPPAVQLAKDNQRPTAPVRHMTGSGARPSRPTLTHYRRPSTPPLRLADVHRRALTTPSALATAEGGENQGIILVLGDPQPVARSSECYLKVSLPDGNSNEFRQKQTRDENGQLELVSVSYRNTVAARR